MSERERESEVIEIDNDITAPGASKQTNWTVTDKLIKKPSHEDFVAAWSEEVIGKGLTFDFFHASQATCLVHGTVQCVSLTCAQCLLHHGQSILPHAT